MYLKIQKTIEIFVMPEQRKVMEATIMNVVINLFYVTQNPEKSRNICNT